ncbi:hypothetical protein MBLNU459_g7385t1 [Dothideomycetes sp. NU459]
MAGTYVASNVLAAHSLSIAMASTLPEGSLINTPYDAVALAAHACMLAVGFRLIGLGEDNKIEAPAETSTPIPLPSAWNASSPNNAFRYAHSQSSMEYLLKVNRMGNKAVVMGMGLGDDKTTSFDVRVVDYVSESSLPATPKTESSTSEQTATGLVDIFISNGRLSDFGSLMRLNVIQKLLPGLQKEGYEESSAESTSSTSASRASATPRREPEAPRHDPLREDFQPPARPHPLAQPRRPFPAGEFMPPGFEDPYDVNRSPGILPGRPGFGNIGEQDLYPQGLGPNDPIRGGIGPGFGGGFGGGGMHPTLDDPLFRGQGRRDGGYDPQAPPGSRYDPIGPGGAPRGNGGGGGFPGGRTGGQPPNPFSGFGSGDFI